MTKKKVNIKSSDDLLTSFGIDRYKPKSREKYMSKKQLNHFKNILLIWKSQLEQEAGKTVNHMQNESINYADPNDRASQESDFGLELRTRDRERKLLKKIQQSLYRIESGSYGYCEETGEAIGLKRLEARPVATLCLEAQERREITEKQYSDTNDYLR
jgi:DnaK suppressor protein|tara:strand:- start:159 stop:632 length:474 start_codon:yes stop_codon:yes gene_type:complete